MGKREEGRGKREDVNYTFPLCHNSTITQSYMGATHDHEYTRILALRKQLCYHPMFRRGRMDIHSSIIAPWLPIFVQPRRGVFVSDEVRIRVLRLPQTEGRSDETTHGEGLSQKTFHGSRKGDVERDLHAVSSNHRFGGEAARRTQGSWSRVAHYLLHRQRGKAGNGEWGTGNGEEGRGNGETERANYARIRRVFRWFQSGMAAQSTRRRVFESNESPMSQTGTPPARYGSA